MSHPAQAMVARGPLLFVSGQIAIGPGGQVLHRDDAAAQAEFALQQLDAILLHHGCARQHVVKVTTYLLDMRDLDGIRRVRSAYFGDHLPAATTVQVAGLARPGLLVEIDAIAAVPMPDAAPDTASTP